MHLTDGGNKAQLLFDLVAMKVLGYKRQILPLIKLLLLSQLFDLLFVDGLQSFIVSLLLIVTFLFKDLLSF